MRSFSATDPTALPRLSLTLDRARSKRSEWTRARKAEANYGRQLRKIARHVADIIAAFDPTVSWSAAAIAEALDRYAGVIEGWARATGKVMVAEVERRDYQTWKEISGEIGTRLRQEIATAPTGQAMREALDRQTALITSLPREAAERVRKVTLEAITTGRRAEDIAEEILATGEVTKARANTIARTEVSRTATELTKARAESIGSTQFIWHTSHDSDVRASHKKLDGKVFRWDEPPETDPGYRALPGGIFNCRCWAEPIIPDED